MLHQKSLTRPLTQPLTQPLLLSLRKTISGASLSHYASVTKLLAVPYWRITLALQMHYLAITYHHYCVRYRRITLALQMHYVAITYHSYWRVTGALR